MNQDQQALAGVRSKREGERHRRRPDAPRGGVGPTCSPKIQRSKDPKINYPTRLLLMTSTSTFCCAGGPRLLRHQPHAGGLQPVRDQGKQGGRAGDHDDHDSDNDGQGGRAGCVVDDHDNDGQGGRGDCVVDDHDNDQGGRGGRQAGAGFPRGRQQTAVPCRDEGLGDQRAVQVHHHDGCRGLPQCQLS